MKFKSLLFAALVAFGLASTASASIINAPVPSNAYITIGGLDWAWANPLPADSGTFDLSYQSQFGWRIPTAAELLSAPLATDFLFAGANVPFNGVDPVSGAFFSATNSAYTDAASAGAVASPYFSTTYSHADWQDGLGQTYGPWAGMPGAAGFADQLVVRGLSAVPEPSTLISAAVAGLFGVAVARRRRARTA